MVAGTMGGTTARNQGPNGDTREPNTAPEQIAGLVPFVRASDEHIQPGNVDASSTLTSSQQQLGVFDLPAFGHIRHLYLLVEATGGAGGLATGDFAEDGPWNVLQQVLLTEPNGAFITQFNSGYEIYLANKYGGYNPAVSGDPRNSPAYSISGESDGNFSFIVRIPVELSGRDAVGALPNQDSAGQFKLHVSLAAASTVYNTGPDTLPSVRVRAWLNAWEQPAPQVSGMANSVTPPASGTTSFWGSQTGIAVANGQNTIELKRKGNFLRQVIFVLRTSGSRATAETDWPDQTRFLRDAFPARYLEEEVWQHILYERTGYGAATAETAGTLDNGVRFLDFMHEFDGALGRENRDLWQPTRGSTRLEIAGSFQAASTLDIITNDVSIADNVFL